MSVPPADGGPGLLFAASVGAVEKHREDHLVLGLPLDPAVSAEVDPAYDVVTWRGRCPEEHGGHRLGAALTAVNYADLPEGIGLVHTWTAPSNTAMHLTNTALGFRVVEHTHEMKAVV